MILPAPGLARLERSEAVPAVTVEWATKLVRISVRNFEDMVSRIERGEDPESVMSGGEDADFGGDDDF